MRGSGWSSSAVDEPGTAAEPVCGCGRPVRVGIQADPLSRAGITEYLAPRPEFTVLRRNERHLADVVVVAVPRLAPAVVAGLARAAVEVGNPVVLVPTEFEDSDLAAARGCRIAGVLPRKEATADRLASALLAAVRRPVGGSGEEDPGPAPHRAGGDDLHAAIAPAHPAADRVRGQRGADGKPGGPPGE